jgi:hypothetical protein
VLSHILIAATQPDDLREAAAWSRANSHLSGEDAVRAAEPMAWHPSVKALVAFPDLLARMDESPQWTVDLGAAFLEQEPYVMDTVQALRRRAQASGGLQSNEQYSVQPYGNSIAVYPTQPHIVYLPYYNPYVVYGPWWWHSYRPVYWRSWHPRPAVFISTHFFRSPVDWHRRHVIRHHVHHHHHARPHRAPVTVHNHAHQAQHARPIVQGARIQPAPAPVHRPQVRSQHRPESRPSAPVTIQQRVHPVQPIAENAHRRDFRPGVHHGHAQQHGQRQSHGHQGRSQHRR